MSTQESSSNITNFPHWSFIFNLSIFGSRDRYGAGPCCTEQIPTIINQVIFCCLFAIKSHYNSLTEMEMDLIGVIKQRCGGPMNVSSQVFPLYVVQPILQRRKIKAQGIFKFFLRYFSSSIKLQSWKKIPPRF